MRRPHGRETWNRLLEWDTGQASAERLSAQILRFEGYQSIDPSHPLGGRDGKKDMICTKDGLRWIGACYFPRGQQEYKEIKTKFLDDIEGIEKNSVDGMVFITNQELRLKERRELKKLTSHHVEILHLETLASILDSPSNYGNRMEFLQIPLTNEEHVSVLAQNNEFINEIKQMKQSFEVLSKAYEQSRNGKHNPVSEKEIGKLEGKPANILVNKGEVYLADLGKGIDPELGGIRPVVIISNRINNKFSPTVTILPITSQITKAKLPTHVELGLLTNMNKESVVLAEQIKTISKKRLNQLITTVDSSVMERIEDAIKIQMGLVDF
ncbi:MULTISPECIES: type II toxin-antitoxin system PemK/MazF family toxin [Bacillus]|uniref:type II toxin-antitoxin system PemK/MazF family toxin n=1 Tax=Bacillus TaxID=1386 RepID=UPI00209DE680|nr:MULTISPECIES: type II toxin-antitoxin system PemK/MazF family toxin [Bacillus]MCP1160415.1 type II toxin-antitoxin system PemK/MazF family toxin [Bacillus infantis]